MNALEFQKLVTHPSIKKFKPKIVVGGFGSWQLERKHMTDKYGIDCVLIGGRPDTIVGVFKKALNGEGLQRVVRTDEKLSKWDYTMMPLAKHAAIHGAVEISNGCGRNCQFCTPTVQRKVDVPLEKIVREVAVTANEFKGEGTNITLVTEDLLLYGAKGKSFVPEEETVVKLVESVAGFPNRKRVQGLHDAGRP